MSLMSEVLAFLSDVRGRFQDDAKIYEEFCRIMADFKRDPDVDPEAVIARVEALFHGHSDLIFRFYYFLPEENDRRKGKKFLEKVRDRFRNEEGNVYESFLGVLAAYGAGNESVDGVHRHVAQLFAENKDLLEEFSGFLPKVKEDRPRGQRPMITIRREIPVQKKALWELDTSNLPLCTPSSRFLPENFEESHSSFMGELERSVLNTNVVVSVPSQDYSRAKRRWQSSEEIRMLIREDELFEIHMKIEALRTALKCAKRLKKKLRSSSVQRDQIIRLEDYLGGSDMRRIRTISGDFGKPFVDALRKDTSANRVAVLRKEFKRKLKLLLRRSRSKDD